MPTQALEHLSEQTLEGYRRRELSSEERSAVHDHIADCEDCRLRFKRRLYSTDAERAEAGRRLIHILTTFREESPSPEPARVAEARDVLQPTLLQRLSVAFRVPRLSEALLMASLVLSIAVTIFLHYRMPLESSEIRKPSPQVFMPSIKTVPQQAPTNESPTAAVVPEIEARDDSGRVAAGPKPVAGGREPASAEQANRRPGVNKEPTDRGVIAGPGERGLLAGLESAPPSFREAIEKAVGGKLEMPDEVLNPPSEISEVTRSGEATDAEKKRVALLEPVNKVIRTRRPTLKWQPLAGSKYYVVSVVTPGHDPVELSGELTQTQWTPTKPLTAEEKYYKWQVRAYRDGPQEPTRSTSSWIKVVDETTDRELREAETKYAGSHLLLGSLYARAGLLDEAEREFQLLLKDNPKSPVAQRLLKTVREKKSATSSK